MGRRRKHIRAHPGPVEPGPNTALIMVPEEKMVNPGTGLIGSEDVPAFVVFYRRLFVFLSRRVEVCRRREAFPTRRSEVLARPLRHAAIWRRTDWHESMASVAARAAEQEWVR